MLRLVRHRVSDRPFIALCVALIFSLSIAHLADRDVASAIPEHHLGRIRGTNPAWSESSAGSCTDVNVTTANNQNPPPPPGTGPYVNFNACTIVGAACIYCGSGPGFITYELSNMPGAKPPSLKPINLVGCMTSGGGTIGTCDINLICTSNNPYECNTTGAKWAYQGGLGSPP